VQGQDDEPHVAHDEYVSILATAFPCGAAWRELHRSR
jgi:hypothetical protein